MKIIKVENGYFLSKRDFSDNNKNLLKKKILDSLFNIDANKISKNFDMITVNDSEKIPNIIREPSIIDKFGKNVVRNIKLNLEFNKETKKFELTDKNTEDFDDANTISYFTSCSDFEPDDLYFHESCLIDYFTNILNIDLKNCNTFLGVIFYDVDEIENNNIISKLKDQMYFYCYNKDTGEILMDESNFAILNKNSHYHLQYGENEIEIMIDELNDKKYVLYNYRKVNSFFPLIHQNENDFISFKNTVNIFLYNQFIISLKKRIIEKTLVIDIGVDRGVDICLNNGQLHGYAVNDLGIDDLDPGVDDNLRNFYPNVYFGYNACLIGKNEDELQTWRWSNDYELPFNASKIKSVELISSGRNLSQISKNEFIHEAYESINAENEIVKSELKLENNIISIRDDESRSSEYKFRIYFE